MFGNRIFAAAVFCLLAEYPMEVAVAEISLKFAQAAPAAQQPSQSTRTGEGIVGAVEELQKFLDERKQRLGELDEEIRKGLDTEQRANEIFDRLVGSFKDLIDRIGPNSDYRKRLDDIIARSRKNAEEYAADKDPEMQALANKNTETATMVEKLLNDANAEYARGLATIRSLEGGRKLVVAQIKTGALRAAANAAQKYLDVVRDAINKMEDFNKRVKQGAPSS